ncbi:MAG: hypothetical protein AB2777_21530 [Candidatus Thiodiazotropha endolucinida]
MSLSTPDKRVSENLQAIAARLEKELEEVAGQPMAFSLCVFNSEPGSRINYTSNCKREDVANAWLSMIDGWMDGMPDIPAHKISN